VSAKPAFPSFKPFEFEDRDEIHPRLWAYQPEVSELTFANFYIWRDYYDLQWTIADDCLVFLAERDDACFAFTPVGSNPRAALTERLLVWLRDEKGVEKPEIRRADQRLVDELSDADRFVCEPTRDHFDYVYRSEDLGTLEGDDYRRKRNQVTQFEYYYEYRYEPITDSLLEQCLRLAEVWCEQRQCEDDISLSHEFSGIEDALNHFHELEISGGALLIDDTVRAFALGEKLNEDTAVVHIEKANPDYRNIYPTMTHSYSAERWMETVAFINREQDLGISGLRRAKESYHPDHLVKKYTVTLADD
jgi:hypothetical protein